MSKIDKSLTVGVEIEMTGLARAHAADIVATELGGQVGRMARNSIGYALLKGKNNVGVAGRDHYR